MPKLPMGPQKRSSALSASSSFILLSLSLEDRKTERSQYHKMIYVFVFPKKISAVSAYSAVDLSFILGGRRGFYNFLSNKKSPAAGKRFRSKGEKGWKS
jgi:hypothetical protein